MLITNCLIDGIEDFRRTGINPLLITLGKVTYDNIRSEGGSIPHFRDGPKFNGIRIKVSSNKYEMRVT